MPDPEATQLVITTQNIDLSLNKEDLVAIAVAQYREQVEKEIPILEAQAHALNKDLEKKRKEGWIKLESIAREYFKPVIEAYEKIHGKPAQVIFLDFHLNFTFGQSASSDSVVNSMTVRARFDENIPEIKISGPAIVPDALRTEIRNIMDQTREELKEGYQTLKKLEKRITDLQCTDFNQYRDKAHAKLAQSVIKKLTGEDVNLLRSALNLNEDLALPARPVADED